MEAQLTAASVHIIDDDDSFRRATLRTLTAAGFSATGYRCAADFPMSCVRSGAVCILLDISLPGPSGIELLQALRAQEEELPPVIFVTGRDDVITTIDVMKWGAFSYLLKPIAAATLLQVVRAALLADERRRQLRRDLGSLRARIAGLTADERAIFDGVVNDRLNKQLAAELGVCERTIKAQRARMFAKLQIDSVAELVRLARALQDAERRGGGGVAAWPWFAGRVE